MWSEVRDLGSLWSGVRDVGSLWSEVRNLERWWSDAQDLCLGFGIEVWGSGFKSKVRDLGFTCSIGKRGVGMTPPGGFEM